MSSLDVERTITELREGRLQTVFAHEKKGQRLCGPLRQRPLCNKAINTLVRACLHAAPGYVLGVIDFSQVEARALAWAADDTAALARFLLFDSGDQVNGDPYAAMAAQIFGGTAASYTKGSPGEYPGRHVGKQAELGCGYGMGVDRFHDKVIEDGSSWEAITEAARKSGAIGPHESVTAEMVVGAWRRLHEPIVSFWGELNRACLTAVRGGAEQAGPFEFVNLDGVVLCRLPSSRCIAYRGASESRTERNRPEISYVGKRGREKLYGGKLAENAIQAMCRDLMARALVTAEKEGLRPVHTVHDEIICELPVSEAKDAFALLEMIMVDVPDWCPGLPLAAEGFLCTRYSK